jgi:GTP-binding protein
VALVGRPNVGKSSLVNRLAGQERVIVSEIPGTTRDSIDVRLALGPRRYVLIDTAGIRRPGKRAGPVERFSAVRAARSIERADVAVLVLDGQAGLAAQDAHIAGQIRESYKPMVVAVNKWDLVEEREAEVKRWEEQVRRRLRFARDVPLVFVSASTGQRVLKLLDRVDAVHAAAGIRVPTTELNRWLHQLRPADPDAPPAPGNLRLLYATQTGIQPPSFLVFCNDPRLAHAPVRRQLENQLRERFGFGPAPVRLVFRGRRQARHA